MRDFIHNRKTIETLNLTGQLCTGSVEVFMENTKNRRWLHIIAALFVVIVIIIGAFIFNEKLFIVDDYSITSADQEILEGWYVSGVNESCIEECRKHKGLVCDHNSVEKMKRINTKAAFVKMNASGPNVGCSTYGDDPDPITPFKIISGGYDQCEWRRENNLVTCEAKITDNGHSYLRFCYCSKHYDD